VDNVNGMWIEVSHDENHGGAGWELGTCVWSPARKRTGTTWPSWECLLDVRAGDEVLHVRGLEPKSDGNC
jgi:hypothetical protein